MADTNSLNGGLSEGQGDGAGDRTLAEILERGLARVAEALIFSADEPVSARRIAATYAQVSGEAEPEEAAVRAAIDGLNEAYADTDRTFRIEAWAGGFRMATVPSLAPYLRAVHQEDRQRRLSRSLLETLAIVAYRQPVTKPEVDFVRGVDSDYTVRRLMELGLVDVVGRSDSLGRPLLYGTTPRFLEQFGLNALEDLPNLREIEDILNDPAFNRERARLLELEEQLSPAETRAEAPAVGPASDAGPTDA